MSIAERRQTKKPKDITIDRSKFPKAGMTLTENDYVILKMVSADEHDLYIDVSLECSFMKSMFKDKNFIEDLWGEFLQEYRFVTSIYDKKTGLFVGYCSVKDMRAADWELAIEEKRIYRNQGYGFQAMTLFINKVTELTGQRFYCALINTDNIPSQKLFKKIGCYPDGIKEFLLHGADLKQFQEENSEYIDDEMIRTAEEFYVDPEDLLGHVLQYRLDAKYTTIQRVCIDI